MFRDNYRHDTYSLAQTESLLDHTTWCAADMQERMKVLPDVDHTGNSACPTDMAEKLYAQSENSRRRLERVRGWLYEHEAGATAEIRRLAQNAGVVREDCAHLEGPEVRDRYAQAGDDLEARYRRHLEMRNRIRMKLQFVEQVLAAATARMWPGQAPRDRFDSPVEPQVSLSPPIAPFSDFTPSSQPGRITSASSPGMGLPDLTPDAARQELQGLAELGGQRGTPGSSALGLGPRTFPAGRQHGERSHG